MTTWEERHDYFGRHWRLRHDRGPANRHLCVRHLEDGERVQARDWAQIHGTDGEDPWADYVALCRACHIGYDLSGHRQPHTDTAREKMSQAGRLAYAEGRKIGRNTHNEAKTGCPVPEHGPYDYVAPDGSRGCTKCRKANLRRWRERQRQAGGR